jgi:hypothetical protein
MSWHWKGAAAWVLLQDLDTAIKPHLAGGMLAGGMPCGLTLAEVQRILVLQGESCCPKLSTIITQCASTPVHHSL